MEGVGSYGTGGVSFRLVGWLMGVELGRSRGGRQGEAEGGLTKGGSRSRTVV
jgi:hypothetical protein